MPQPNRTAMNAGLARSLGIAAARPVQAVTHRIPSPTTHAAAPESTTPPVAMGLRFWMLALVGSLVAMGDVMGRGLAPVRFLWAHRSVVMRGLCVLMMPAAVLGTVLARIPDLLLVHPLTTLAGVGFWSVWYFLGMGVYLLVVRWGQSAASAFVTRAQGWADLGARTVSRRQ